MGSPCLSAWFKIYFTTCTWPFRAAQCRHVKPGKRPWLSSSLIYSNVASCSIYSLTASRSPRLAALISRADFWEFVCMLQDSSCLMHASGGFQTNCARWKTPQARASILDPLPFKQAMFPNKCDFTIWDIPPLRAFLALLFPHRFGPFLRPHQCMFSSSCCKILRR